MVLAQYTWLIQTPTYKPIEFYVGTTYVASYGSQAILCVCRPKYVHVVWLLLTQLVAMTVSTIL